VSGCGPRIRFHETDPELPLTNLTFWGHALSAPMLLEGLMLMCFGLAWPLANLRMLHRRQAEGKGMVFTAIILCGYAAGAAAKLLVEPVEPIVWLYVLNFCAVSANLALQWYFGRVGPPVPAGREPTEAPR
jgi:hypothetical protein